MNFETAARPALFVRRFLERQGSVVEAGREGFDALLPGALAERLDVPEYATFGEGLSAESKGQYSVNYGAPLLEKIVDMCCNTVPLASCRLSFPYLKSQGFDRLIQDQFNFRKCLCRVTSTAPVRTDYLLLACRYVVRSDEQKEGLLSLFFHFDTGAFISRGLDMSSNAVVEEAPLPESSRDAARWEKLLKGISAETQGLIAEEIQDFRNSMDRRLKRDTRNIEEYYGALRKEMESSLARAGLSDRLVQDRKEKIALLPDEVARKKEDLVMKYSIRVKVLPCAALFVRTPAVRILCDLHVGREKRSTSLTYNPLTKALDPLVCEGCSQSATTFSLCSSRHLLCAHCEGKCPVCR
jgi:hypothetical protein